MGQLLLLLCSREAVLQLRCISLSMEPWFGRGWVVYLLEWVCRLIYILPFLIFSSLILLSWCCIKICTGTKVIDI